VPHWDEQPLPDAGSTHPLGATELIKLAVGDEAELLSRPLGDGCIDRGHGHESTGGV
jgi:hypothetical protein